MGKSKKRSIRKNIDKSAVVLKRAIILQQIISDINNHEIKEETIKYINLFGITIEELSESGADYEELVAIKHLLFFS